MVLRQTLIPNSFPVSVSRNDWHQVKKRIKNKQPLSGKGASRERRFACLRLSCGQEQFEEMKRGEKPKKLKKPLFSFENSGFDGGRYRT